MRPLILVVNDDGITSKGIRLLIDAVKDLGEVVVVAPDKPQSAMGHAITIANTLRLDKVELFEGIVSYQCSGTPADCVKLAKHHVLQDRSPDLVVSGVNHGSNTSISVLYSGTMSAAIEAALEGIPAIGFSLVDYNPNADMSHIIKYVKHIASQVLQHGMAKGLALNVNFPAKQAKDIEGVKVCRQASARWEEKFDQRKDPYGRDYYWMTGRFINEDKGEDTDEWAIANNYVSVVPCQFDLTAHHAIALLNKEWDII